MGLDVGLCEAGCLDGTGGIGKMDGHVGKGLGLDG